MILKEKINWNKTEKDFNEYKQYIIDMEKCPLMITKSFEDIYGYKIIMFEDGTVKFN